MLFSETERKYTSGMHSGDLTTEQIEQLRQRLLPALKFVRALLERIDAQKFPLLDPLRMRAVSSLDQLEALQQVLDYLAQQRADRDAFMLGCRSEREYKRAMRDRRNG